MRLLLHAVLLLALLGVTSCQAAIASVYSVIASQNTSTGIALTLNATNPVNLYGADVQQLTVSYDAINPNVCRVKIFDPNNQRWEVPETLVPRPTPSTSSSDSFIFLYEQYPFGFSILRSDTYEVIFNSSSPTVGLAFNNLVFEDQYLELSTQLEDDPYIYGLGERMDNFRLTVNKTYTIWNVDQGYAAWQSNLYGTHPFYMRIATDTSATHGVLLLSSNGMDVTLSSGALTYRVIGGVFEFYFFLGPTPSAVLQQYHQLIGTPRLPPYWALGWHQCRYGYPNLQYLQSVVANYSAAQIPLDTMWTDIDYMDAFEDFTFDPFPADQMNAFVEQLHGDGQHYVVIVDPGIHTTVGYEPFDQLILYGLAIMNNSQMPFAGQVWPGETVFPDFLNPLTSKYWQVQIANFLSVVPIDGLWIDMNEISNFCDGQEQEPGLANCVLPPYFNQTGKPLPLRINAAFDPNNPPYQINNFNLKAPLNHKTLDADCVHDGNILEYNAHNLYGFTEAIATCTALETIRNERCFVISRSTFPGSGAHGGHWTGDNDSDWPDMYNSIGGVLLFQMFGVPLVGADICGFRDNTTEELCGRWTAFGSFYPFSRNHNNAGRPYPNIPQEPYRWASVAGTAFCALQVSQLAAIARKYLSLRYSLLPYYYTLFYETSLSGGGVWHPLFEEFIGDENTWDISNQFMIGDTLLVTPVLLPNATSVYVYFPAVNGTSTLWYEYLTGEVAFNSSLGGNNVSTPAPIDYIPLHIRGGYGVITQQPALTTTASRMNNYSLVFALNSTGESTARVYLDDGVTIAPTATSYAFYTINYPLISGSSGSISSTGIFGYALPNSLVNITIFGATVAPKSFTLSGAQMSFSSSSASVIVVETFLPMTGPWTIQVNT